VNGSHLYLIGADDTGFKLARVAATVGKIGDRNQVSYQLTRAKERSADELR
jgi:hypothetical protein